MANDFIALADQLIRFSRNQIKQKKITHKSKKNRTPRKSIQINSKNEPKTHFGIFSLEALSVFLETNIRINNKSFSQKNQWNSREIGSNKLHTCTDLRSWEAEKHRGDGGAAL